MTGPVTGPVTGPAAAELIDLPEMSAERWADYALAQGWGDGLPMVMPAEAAVAAFVSTLPGNTSPIPPVPPRNVVPTLRSVAANAVMAGCRPEYFPVVLTALRAVLEKKYNLHGTVATTHPCGNMILVSGPGSTQLGINAGGNCFGQGAQANATIGRALQLILGNIGGGKPGSMDHATQGSPAKYSFCFGESEADSPWEPYRVRLGFKAGDTLVTVMAGEAPHNINDHASKTGDELLTTTAQTMSQTGANNILGLGPCFIVYGPEHAATLARDKWTIPDIQHELYERSRIHFSRVTPSNRDYYVYWKSPFRDDHYYLAPSAADIHVVVAGGPGKHSAYIPSFSLTDVVSLKVPDI